MFFSVCLKKYTEMDSHFKNLYLKCLLAVSIGICKSLIYTNLEGFLINTSLEQANIPKVSLTQKGYIQFLKYNIKVPEISDYTFCIWIRSNNLTYAHPLLSYSKHESQRLIRLYITPHGSEIILELFEVLVFSIPMNLMENRFYHICQSWDSHLGTWALYLDGNLNKIGVFTQFKNALIPSNGDIVVGQEYTDFDKGLDDGIEGDISGVNLVLASTFRNNRNYLITTTPFRQELREGSDKRRTGAVLKTNRTKMILPRSSGINDNMKLTVLKSSFWNREKRKVNVHSFSADLNIKRKLSLSELYQKPLGLILVKLSNDCAYLKGAPLSGKGVLVNWTKTPVKVFGGAIFKTVLPFCARTKYST